MIKARQYDFKLNSSTLLSRQSKESLLKWLLCGIDGDLLFEALVKVNDVVLAELPKHFDFAHCGLLDDFVVIRLLKLLNRHYICKSGIRIRNRQEVYLPVSPVSLLRAMKTFP